MKLRNISMLGGPVVAVSMMLAASDDRVGMDVSMALAGLTVTVGHGIRHVARQQLDSCGR